MKNMRFDNNTIKKVVSLVKHHDIVFEESSVFVKQWLSILGEEQFKRLIELRKADILGQDPDRFERRLEKVYNVKKITDKIINNDECYSLKQLAINGNDLIKLGYEDKKIYGWFENVWGYVTECKKYCEENNLNWEDFWKKNKENKIYLVHAKDNIPFHTVIFPSLLSATEDNP